MYIRGINAKTCKQAKDTVKCINKLSRLQLNLILKTSEAQNNFGKITRNNLIFHQFSYNNFTYLLTMNNNRTIVVVYS